MTVRDSYLQHGARIAMSLAGVTLAGALSACSGESPAAAISSSRDVEGASKAVTKRMDVLMAAHYPSFAALRKDSVGAVIVKAGTSRPLPVVGGDGLVAPQTATTVSVTRQVWGKTLASTLTIVQLGDETTVSDAGPVLVRDHTYLLFVREATLPGYYVITGVTSAYEQVGSSFRALVPGDVVGTSRPAAFDAARASQVVLGS